jgi:hypothetical protein
MPCPTPAECENTGDSDDDCVVVTGKKAVDPASPGGKRKTVCEELNSERYCLAVLEYHDIADFF